MTVMMPTKHVLGEKNEAGSFQSNATPVESPSRSFCSRGTIQGFDSLD